MLRLILITICTSLFISQSSWAALGDHEQIITSDVSKLKSSNHTIERRALFTVHELSTPVAQVKEYVDQSGNVFAVSWSGIHHPDLSILLGNYYEEYKAADARHARATARQPNNVRTSRMALHSGGHMRAVTGYAIISDQLPAGVTVGDLK